jgi:acetylornithine deacetylase/succinyl-diaminopimelate desuccinylase-like protein
MAPDKFSFDEHEAISTDASILVPGKGFPVLIYGPGDENMMHRVDEYVEIEKYLGYE